MKAILPFSLNLLEYSESDFWIYVNIKEDAEILPGIAPDCKETHTVLNQAAMEYSADDLDNLLNGLAGSLFPLVFSSKYIKLAQLKSRLDLHYSIPEQILFWLIESGAKTYHIGSLDQNLHFSTPLTHLAYEINATKHFLYSFSSYFEGIAINRKPDRFSYKSLFWVSDDRKILYKLYRYPGTQPTGIYDNPVFNCPVTNIPEYYGFGAYSDDCRNDRTWISMQNLSDGENCSDWIDREMRKKASNSWSWIPSKAIKVWMTFLQNSVIPRDMSLSNAIVVRGKEIIFVDLEEVVGIDETFGDKTGMKRPILCFLSILFYLMTAIDPMGTKSKLRYDEFRDKCFVSLWHQEGVSKRWVIDKNGAKKDEHELLRLFEGIMNSNGVSGVFECCEKIMAKC